MHIMSIIKLSRAYVVTIPKMFMNILNLKKGDKVAVYLYEGLVIIRPLDGKDNDFIRRLEDGEKSTIQASGPHTES